MREDWARRHWRAFQAMEGSREIASEYAIRGLGRWLRRLIRLGETPQHVLEIGGGIGTLTAVLTAYLPGAEIVTLEPDSWCAGRLRDYFQTQAVRVVPSWEPPAGVWDVVVVDGGPPATLRALGLVGRRLSVFFEGGRRDHQLVLREAWRGSTYTWARWRPADRSKGFALYQFHPTRWERTWFAVVRGREWARDRWARVRGRTVGKKRQALA